MTMDEMINLLAASVKPVVAYIEAKPTLTKDHYDDYMVALSKLAEKTDLSAPHPSVYLAIGVALQRAGANKSGVQSALRIMGHI